MTARQLATALGALGEYGEERAQRETVCTAVKAADAGWALLAAAEHDLAVASLRAADLPQAVQDADAAVVTSVGSGVAAALCQGLAGAVRMECVEHAGAGEEGLRLLEVAVAASAGASTEAELQVLLGTAHLASGGRGAAVMAFEAAAAGEGAGLAAAAGHLSLGCLLVEEMAEGDATERGKDELSAALAVAKVWGTGKEEPAMAAVVAVTRALAGAFDRQGDGLMAEGLYSGALSRIAATRCCVPVCCTTCSPP